MRTSNPTPWHRRAPIRSALAALLIALVALTATSAVYAVAFSDDSPPGGRESPLPNATYGYDYGPISIGAVGTNSSTQFFIEQNPPPTYVPPIGTRLPNGLQLVQTAQNRAEIRGRVTETVPVGQDYAEVTFVVGVTGDANTPPGSLAVAGRGYLIRVYRAPLTIRAVNQSRVYGEPNSTLTYTVEGLRGTDTESLVLTGALATTANAGSEAGTYPITQGSLRLTPDGAQRYTINFVPGTLTVTRAPLTVVASSQSREYGMPDPPLSYTANLRAGDRADQVFTGSLATNATVNSPVGTYPITQGSLGLSGYGAARYTLNSFVPSTLTVTRAPLTVVANNRSRPYGGANPSLTYTANLRGGDTPDQVLTGSLVTPTTVTSPVGDYPINRGTLGLSEYGADRYTMTFEPGTLAVTPAPLTVRANDVSRLIGNPNPPFTVSYTGFMNGEGPGVLQGELSFTTTATESSPLGAYPIVPSGLTSNNYYITFVNGTLTVTDRDVPEITWPAPAAITYGTPLSAAQFNATASFGGQAVPGTFTYDPAPGTVPAAGTRNLQVTFTPTDTTNFAPVTVNRTITVNRAPLTIRANDATRQVGAPNPAFSATFSGFVNGENESVLDGTLSFTTTATESSPPGAYPIVPSGLTSSNYSITYVEGTLRVTNYQIHLPLLVR